MTDQAEVLKDVEEVNLKALADALAQALTDQVGGRFAARVTKLDHTHLRYADDQIVLQFHLTDEDWMGRGEFRDVLDKAR